MYGELGLYPLYIDAIERMLKYWLFMENESENGLLKEALSCSKIMNEQNRNSWMKFAQNICTLSEDCSNHNPEILLSKKIIFKLIQTLKQNYRNWWKKNLLSDEKTKSRNGCKLRTYRKFKEHHSQETYLSIISDRNMRTSMTKFRVSDHRPQIEIGRH